jgi:hypothetical protein
LANESGGSANVHKLFALVIGIGFFVTTLGLDCCCCCCTVACQKAPCCKGDKEDNEKGVLASARRLGRLIVTPEDIVPMERDLYTKCNFDVLNDMWDHIKKYIDHPSVDQSD